jgi:pimeloyl-ACP methyl ester carboxylesterase
MSKMIGTLRCVSLAVLAASFAGCATPERVAKLVVTAPNVQRAARSSQWADQWLRALCGGTNRFQTINIPVGPPEATLNAMQLSAGDYHLDFVSSVENDGHGRKLFSLKAIPRTNSPLPVLEEERGTILLLHGYSIQKETMAPWAFVLAQAGYRVILLDLRGHGQSTGKIFSCGKYETSDLVQVLDYLEAKGICCGKVGVLGISFGADLALQWAARDPRVAAVVAIAPYDQPEDAFVRFAQEMKIPVSIKVLEQALVLVASRLDLRWADWSGRVALGQLKSPVFLIGGGKDTISPPGDLEALTRAAPAGTKSLLIPEANHFVVGYWFQEIAEPVTTWFGERLMAEKLPAPTTNIQ